MGNYIEIDGIKYPAFAEKIILRERKISDIANSVVKLMDGLTYRDYKDIMKIVECEISSNTKIQSI